MFLNTGHNIFLSQSNRSCEFRLFNQTLWVNKHYVKNCLGLFVSGKHYVKNCLGLFVSGFDQLGAWEVAAERLQAAGSGSIDVDVRTTKFDQIRLILAPMRVLLRNLY
jgi:hypothetical protein